MIQESKVMQLGEMELLCAIAEAMGADGARSSGEGKKVLVEASFPDVGWVKMPDYMNSVDSAQELINYALERGFTVDIFAKFVDAYECSIGCPEEDGHRVYVTVECGRPGEAVARAFLAYFGEVEE